MCYSGRWPKYSGGILSLQLGHPGSCQFTPCINRPISMKQAQQKINDPERTSLRLEHDRVLCAAQASRPGWSAKRKFSIPWAQLVQPSPWRMLWYHLCRGGKFSAWERLITPLWDSTKNWGANMKLTWPESSCDLLDNLVAELFLEYQDIRNVPLINVSIADSPLAESLKLSTPNLRIPWL